MLGHLAYLSAIVVLASFATTGMLGAAKEAALVVGALGMWRYSWRR